VTCNGSTTLKQNRNSFDTVGHAVVEAVPWLGSVTAEAWVRSQASQPEICGGKRGTGTDFPSSTSVFPCQYNSASDPYAFIHHRRYIILPTGDANKGHTKSSSRLSGEKNYL
jgi:hypothetical protein